MGLQYVVGLVICCFSDIKLPLWFRSKYLHYRCWMAIRSHTEHFTHSPAMPNWAANVAFDSFSFYCFFCVFYDVLWLSLWFTWLQDKCPPEDNKVKVESRSHAITEHEYKFILFPALSEAFPHSTSLLSSVCRRQWRWTDDCGGMLRPVCQCVLGCSTVMWGGRTVEIKLLENNKEWANRNTARMPLWLSLFQAPMTNKILL